MRKPAIFLLFFAAGVFLAVYAFAGAAVWIAAAAGAAAAPFFLLFRDRGGAFWLLGCLGLSCGLLYTAVYATVLTAPVRDLDGRRAELSAVVISIQEDLGRQTSVDARVDGTGFLPFRIRIVADESLAGGIGPGDRVSLRAELSSAVGKGVWSRGCCLTAQAEELTVTGRAFPGLRGVGSLVSQRIGQALEAAFPVSSRALASAALTGDSTLFRADSATAGSFQATGLSHTVSSPGVGLILLLAFPALFFPGRRRLALAAIPSTVLLAVLSGLAPSALWAAAACLFFGVSACLRKPPDRWTTISAALAAVLLTDPYAAASAALHLTFGSLLGGLLFSGRIWAVLMKPFRRLSPKKRRVLSLFLAVPALCLGAAAVTVPLSALHFGRISPAFPPAALLVLLLLPAAYLLSALATGLALLFVPAGAAAALPASMLLRLIRWIAVVFARFSLSSVYTDSPAVVCWIVAAYVVLLVLLLVRVPLRRWAVPLCLLAAALCAALAMPRLAPADGLTVTAVDVGQGQCVVLRSGTSVAVVDCGSVSGEDAGRRLLSWLKSRGIFSVDLLLLTHYHADHVNGVPALLDGTETAAVVLPPPDGEVSWDETVRELAGAAGCRIYTVGDESVRFSLDGALVTVFPPAGGEEENERCLACLFSEDGCDVLITGDMPVSGERQLLSNARLPDIEVLVAGHHGSSTSTSQALLDAVRPEIVLISVGENSYGHPSPEVLDRLSRSGASVFRTDVMGTVTVTQDLEVR